MVSCMNPNLPARLAFARQGHLVNDQSVRQQGLSAPKRDGRALLYVIRLRVPSIGCLTC